jgi:hypothetical protein
VRKAPLTAGEALNGLCPNIIPQWFPLLRARPDIMTLINGYAKPLALLKKSPDFDWPCFHDVCPFN